MIHHMTFVLPNKLYDFGIHLGSGYVISGSHEEVTFTALPKDHTQLRELRKNISMELLWIQQAIDSRKNVYIVSCT